jgi:hypothetical protein
MQTSLTNAQVQARIAENQGEAELARARKAAEQTVVVAEAALAKSRREAEQKVVLAEADSRERMLAGRGESQRIMQVGLSEAMVLLRKISSYGDPRLFAVNQVADRLSKSQQPLVPERLFVAQGANGDKDGAQPGNLLGLLMSLLLAEKSGITAPEVPELAELHSLEKELTGEAIGTMRRGIVNGSGAAQGQ